MISIRSCIVQMFESICLFSAPPTSETFSIRARSLHSSDGKKEDGGTKSSFKREEVYLRGWIVLLIFPIMAPPQQGSAVYQGRDRQAASPSTRASCTNAGEAVTASQKGCTKEINEGGEKKKLIIRKQFPKLQWVVDSNSFDGFHIYKIVAFLAVITMASTYFQVIVPYVRKYFKKNRICCDTGYTYVSHKFRSK